MTPTPTSLHQPIAALCRWPPQPSRPAPLHPAGSNPDDGSHLLASLEQAIPIQRQWLNFTRCRLRADKPIHFGPLCLHLKAKGGHVHGDLPSYEAFPIGGTNSVRGYSGAPRKSKRSFVTRQIMPVLCVVVLHFFLKTLLHRALHCMQCATRLGKFIAHRVPAERNATLAGLASRVPVCLMLEMAVAVACTSLQRVRWAQGAAGWKAARRCASHCRLACMAAASSTTAPTCTAGQRSWATQLGREASLESELYMILATTPACGSLSECCVVLLTLLRLCLLLLCCRGYGYGGGVRVDTPLGPLRLEYAWNDNRVGRFHVGVGYD